MIDLDRLRRQHLSPAPWMQRFVATLMHVDYRFPRRTRIDVHGLSSLPETPCFLAMNHTDRYNYWPFQYKLWTKGGRFTATWVKGKYYENRLQGAFLDAANNIPLPSRGYVLSTEYRKAMGQPLGSDEYRALRTLVDTGELPDEALPSAISAYLNQSGGPQAFLSQFEDHFDELMREVVRLNNEAFEQGNFVLVFPQGTRSRRLSKGHTGLAQIAQHMGKPIIPIGCSGSDVVYPGGSPKAKGGHVIYRIGKALPVDGPELGPHRITESFVPFTRAAAGTHKEKLEAITQIVMDRINELLDEPYQYSQDLSSDGVSGMNRFL